MLQKENTTFIHFHKCMKILSELSLIEDKGLGSTK